MLRKVLAPIFSAVLIAAAALAPGFVQAQAAPNTVLAGYAGPNLSDGDDFLGIANGGWGYNHAQYTVAITGTVTSLWMYGACSSGPDGCGSDTVYLVMYDQSGANPVSCHTTYPGNGQPGSCNITATPVTQGQTVYLAEFIPTNAAGSMKDEGVASSSLNDTSSAAPTVLECNNATGAPATPPATILTTASTGCSGTGKGTDHEYLALAALGTASAATTNPVAGNPSLGTHTTTVAAHKIQAYRFINVPGSNNFVWANFLAFFANSSSTATSWNGGVYNDNGGAPGDLLTECNQPHKVVADSQTPGGWNICSLNPYTVVEGATYWLAVWNGDATNNLIINDTSAAVSTECVTSAVSAAGLPGTWSTTGQTTCAASLGNVYIGTGVD